MINVPISMERLLLLNSLWQRDEDSEELRLEARETDQQQTTSAPSVEGTVTPKLVHPDTPNAGPEPLFTARHCSLPRLKDASKQTTKKMKRCRRKRNRARKTRTGLFHNKRFNGDLHLSAARDRSQQNPCNSKSFEIAIGPITVTTCDTLNTVVRSPQSCSVQASVHHADKETRWKQTEVSHHDKEGRLSHCQIGLEDDDAKQHDHQPTNLYLDGNNNHLTIDVDHYVQVQDKEKSKCDATRHQRQFGARRKVEGELDADVPVNERLPGVTHTYQNTQMEEFSGDEYAQFMADWTESLVYLFSPEIIRRLIYMFDADGQQSNKHLPYISSCSHSCGSVSSPESSTSSSEPADLQAKRHWPVCSPDLHSEDSNPPTEELESSERPPLMESSPVWGEPTLLPACAPSATPYVTKTLLQEVISKVLQAWCAANTLPALTTMDEFTSELVDRILERFSSYYNVEYVTVREGEAQSESESTTQSNHQNGKPISADAMDVDGCRYFEERWQFMETDFHKVWNDAIAKEEKRMADKEEKRMADKFMEQEKWMDEL